MPAGTRALGRKDRRREHRRLTVAVFSTALAVPLLLLEVAGGADASPDARPTAYVAEAATPEASDSSAADETARGLGFVTADDLATARTLGVFGMGDELRAEAAAEEAEAAEQARAAEEEQLRLREEREVAAEIARKAEQDRIAREQAAEAQAAQAAAETAAAQPAAVGGPSAGQWQALRNCESGGNYQAVSGNGLYRGAYQFYQGTWDNTARAAGRSDLVGVPPNEASPADQDALAQSLYQSRGHRPWPHCGSHLR